MAINVEVIQDVTQVSIQTAGVQGVAGVAGGPGAPGGMLLPFAVAGGLSVKAYPLRWYVPQTMTITSVRASVGTPSTGASIIVDLNKNGTTIFTTQANRPTIAAGSNTATSTPDITSLTAGDYLTVDVDQIGSTVSGEDLTVQVVLA